MIITLKAILIRSRGTALEDTVGLIALFVLLFAALSVTGGA